MKNNIDWFLEIQEEAKKTIKKRERKAKLAAFIKYIKMVIK